MPQEKPRHWPVALVLFGAVLLAGCTPGRRGAPAEGGADGFNEAAWGAAEDCAEWHFAAPRWTVSWPVAWSGEAPLPPRAMAALAAGIDGAEGGADGFTQTGLLPQAPGCALPAATWLSPFAPGAGALAWTPGRLAVPEEAGAPGDAEEDARLMPGDLAASRHDFGFGRRPGAPLGVDPSGPYLSLWPGAGGQGGGGGGGAGTGPTPADDQDGGPNGGPNGGPPVESIVVDTQIPVLAPVIVGATIPEPATMALLGAALVGLGLLRRWD